MGERDVLALRVCYAASGFADEEDAGGDVLRGQHEFPEGVEAAACDVGEIERGGSGAAHAGGFGDDATELWKIGRYHVRMLAGESCSA